jgi:hypothetical protein
LLGGWTASTFFEPTTAAGVRVGDGLIDEAAVAPDSTAGTVHNKGYLVGSGHVVRARVSPPRCER